jgi:hypothetical protein
MVTYEVFQSLGIQVQIRPALDYRGHWRTQHIEDDFSYDDRIGRKLTGPVTSDMGGSDGYDIMEPFDDFPEEELEVEWLNEPVKDTKEFQFAFLAVSFMQLACRW